MRRPPSQTKSLGGKGRPDRRHRAKRVWPLTEGVGPGRVKVFSQNRFVISDKSHPILRPGVWTWTDALACQGFLSRYHSRPHRHPVPLRLQVLFSPGFSKVNPSGLPTAPPRLADGP